MTNTDTLQETLERMRKIYRGSNIANEEKTSIRICDEFERALATLSKPEPAAVEEEALAEQAYSKGYEWYRNKWIGDHVEMNADLVRCFIPRPSPSEAISPPDARAVVEALAKAIRESVSAYEGKGKVMPNLPLSRHMAEAALAALQSTGASK